MSPATPSSPSSDRPRALLAGATGLVGGHLLDLLLEPGAPGAEPTYGEVTCLLRRSLGQPLGRARPASAEEAEPHLPRLREEIVDFDRLDEEAERSPELFSAHHVFCCLGTTLKKAGSREAFQRVDRGYVETLARLARQAGARAFFLVSSVGADPESGNFYLRVKGELETTLAGLGLPALHVFQPGILQGERRESRPLERLGLAAMKAARPLLRGSLAQYRPISAERVARAMAAAARAELGEEGAGGDHAYEVHRYEEMMRLAGA